MATRRLVSQEKIALESEDRIVSGTRPATEPSNITPAVPTSVIVKLLAFTVAMILGPIGSYYLTLDTIFGGNSTYAGAFAAILANVILIAYVIVAMQEDQSEQAAGKAEGKKDR
ncbi:hypothetical protein GQ53DRAFT_845651 [Thozetella sp. PMI_491]|nr:hypothetical protein GQ53DRAFT_845651 [Thozetella sp. PMI_491]